MPIKLLTRFLSALFVVSLTAKSAFAADGLRYQLPPAPMVEMVDAPPIPQSVLSPTGEWLMLLERPALPPLSELAQPDLRLAGVRINPRTNDQSRTGHAVAIKLVRVGDRAEKSVSGLPPGTRIGDAQWSPDGRRVAFSVIRDASVELMVADAGNGAGAKRVTERALNGVLGRPFVWNSDSRSLLVNLIPFGRGGAPKVSAVPAGPVVQENLGRRNVARTYQDLLKTPHDEALFEYFATAELAHVTLEGKVTPLAQGMMRGFMPSPNGEYVLVQYLKRPFSYAVPYQRFPLRTEIRDAREVNAGKVLKVLSDLGLAEDEETDPDAVRKGPRQYSWRGDAPATVTWITPIEGRRNGLGDILQVLSEPFDGDGQPLFKSELRVQQVYWGRDDLALVVEGQRKARRVLTWRVYPNDPGRSAVKLFDRSSEDRYGDPGSPLMESNSRGGKVMNISPDGRAIYLMAAGAGVEGERPFVDRFEVDSRESRRLFRSEAPFFEQPMALLDKGGAAKLLLQRESINDAPNVYLRELGTGNQTQVTRYSTPRNPIAVAVKEVIRYKRKDGIELSATLYLPPGYKKSDGPLPLLMWAYPREFRSSDAAGQIAGSPYRYSRPAFSGPLPFLTQGYAVLDNPSMPIIGDNGKEPNDSYLPQLVANAEAAVDEVIRRGITERGRIAVGGHSYGAFMVANLLAHTKLFAAGIAESGAYNRTLTPFGFQAEDRNYWKARDVYSQMSPFNFADQIKAPLLLIHGDADSNTGTFPIQSERLYQAMRGLGGTVRLTMLPHEDHGYRGRESVLHRLWEELRWLDRYVKHGGR